MKGAVSMVFFSSSHAVMLQNWVYTAVRWALALGGALFWLSLGGGARLAVLQ